MEAPLLRRSRGRPALMRAYMLGLYLVLMTNQCLFWFTFSSSSTPGVKEYFGWDNTTLDVLLAWGPIFGLVAQPAATALLAQPDGIRRSMRLAASLSFACCVLRLLPSLFGDEDWRGGGPAAIFICQLAIHLAQILNAAAGPFLMSGCSTLSAQWFPPSQRGWATAIAYCGGNVGSAVGFALGPLIIANQAPRVATLLGVELAMAAVPMLCCACVLPHRPDDPASEAPQLQMWDPTPPELPELPEASAAHTPNLTSPPLASPPLTSPPRRRRVSLGEAFGRAKRATLHGPLAALTLVAGIEGGIVAAWGGVLPQQIAPPAFSAGTASLVGILNGVSCLLGNLVGGRLCDALRHSLGALLVAAFVGGGLGFGGYALSLPSVFAPAALLPTGAAALVGWASAAGFCQGIADPVLYEYSARRLRACGLDEFLVEGAEATTGSLLVASWNLSALVVLVLAPLMQGAEGANVMAAAVFFVAAAVVAFHARTPAAHKQARSSPSPPPPLPSPTLQPATPPLLAPLPPSPPSSSSPPPPWRIAAADEAAWRAHLRTEGFVVLAGCLSAAECAHAEGLLWDWLEGLGSGLRRSAPSSWRDAAWPGHARFGFLQSRGGGHTQAAWYVRAHPAVRRAFELVWGTAELVASLDTPIVWRPWWLQPGTDGEGAAPREAWRPTVERLHCDQNPLSKPGFHCVQGMVPLVPVTSEVGGLQVVPRTHGPDVQAHLIRNYPQLASNGGDDWCELEPTDPYMGRGTLLTAEPGDLILWDSRTLHGGLVGPGPGAAPAGGAARRAGAARLARASFTVCMTPRSRASAEVLEQRQVAHRQGITLTHWPHVYAPHTLGETGGGEIPERQFVAAELSVEQQGLL